MSSNSRRPALWLALLSLVVLLTAGVAACARLSQAGPGASPFPTAGPIVQPTAQPVQPTAQPVQPTAQPVQPTAQPVQPTAQPGQPTAQPTAAPGQPTAQPGQPVIGFNPKAGGPGTVVDVFGSGYTPGRWYVVRLGTPQPVGEVLFSAQAGADGRWSGKLTLPVNLPSGQPIASGQLFLVAMDDQNKALASASFAFTAGPVAKPHPQSVQELITVALDETFRGGDPLPYLSPDMVAAIRGGRSAYDVLGLRLADTAGYAFGEQYGYPGASIGFVPVTILYYGGHEERVFSVGIDYSQNPPLPKIYSSELASEGRPVAYTPEVAATMFLTEVWAERSGRMALPYLYGELRDRVISGEQVDLLEEGGVGPMTPLRGYGVNRVVAEDAAYKWVEVTLDLDGQSAVRFVKVQQVGGFWRVAAVVSSLTGEPPPAYPGAGWTAWKSGDFNGDGFEETVYLKETSAVGQDRISDPLLNSDSLNATAVLVVQRGPQNAYPILEIDSQGVRGADGYSLSFASPERPEGAAFFQVAVSYAYEGRFLHVLPLKADGYAHSQYIAFKWHPDFGGYRLIGGPFGEW